MSVQVIAQLKNKAYGVCELVGIVGTSWRVKLPNGMTHNVPQNKQHHYDVMKKFAPIPADTPVEPIKASIEDLTTRELKFIIESLRKGLQPKRTVKDLIVGYDGLASSITAFLENVKENEGAVQLTHGSYGKGKTLKLQITKEIAVAQGFVSVSATIDKETRLSNPPGVYHQLISSMSVPGSNAEGPIPLIEKLLHHLKSNVEQVTSLKQQAELNEKYLEAHLECKPLAWLLSDPEILNKPELLAMLQAVPKTNVPEFRRKHVLTRPAQTWTAFQRRTQGDFASYLLSGWSRLATLLGFGGLIVLLDESEKWEDLDWYEKTLAGNLLLGLIWGATAADGQRTKSSKPPVLTHSGLWGGYPFTTKCKNNLGLMVALTPRENGPEEYWRKCGDFSIVDLPTLTSKQVRNYVRVFAHYYCNAYELNAPNERELGSLTEDVISRWSENLERSTRDAINATVGVFEEWRREK